MGNDKESAGGKADGQGGPSTKVDLPGQSKVDSQGDIKNLSELKVLRSNTKGSLTRAKKLISTKGDKLTATELECRLGILESYFKQIMQVQMSIERFNVVSEQSANDSFRDEVEEIYVSTKSVILSLLSEHKANSTSGADQLNATQYPQRQPSYSKLEAVRLPTFSGKFSEYPNFMGLFLNLVDKEDIDNLQKLNYLRRCLSGAALSAIKEFDMIGANYRKALDRLKQRFDNKNLIFQEHINSLMRIQKVTKVSALSLRHLEDSFNTHLTAMLSIGTHEDICNAILISLALDRVDADTKAKWQDSIDYSQLPSWEEFTKILDRRCINLEAKESQSSASEPFQKGYKDDNQQRFRNEKKSERVQRSFKGASLTVQCTQCEYCRSEKHTIESCTDFQNLSVARRFHEVKKLVLCINCLEKRHSVRRCSKGKCAICSLPHHQLLHRFTLDSAGQHETTSEPGPSSSVLVGRCDNQVVLATAVVLIKDRYGVYQPVRALLDSASQLNFISEHMAQRLKLSKIKTDVQISGIGSDVTNIRNITKAICKSRISDFKTELELLIIKNITNPQPSKSFETNCLKIPDNIVLADPKFNEASKIDLLIGAEHFFELLAIGQIKLEDKLILQKTLFGWVVSGRQELNASQKAAVCLVGRHEVQDDLRLHELVERFWEIENVNVENKFLTSEEEKCENHFIKTVKKDEHGRFIVRFPFKTDPSKLGESYEMAKKRFLALERRLDKNPSIKRQYIDFMEEYETLGHMKEVRSKSSNHMKYFCPHQFVLRPDSTTTKLRVVFDCSARTSSGVSLNDILLKGPTIQDELYSIILRFRCYRYALTADISKMYRQILVDVEDRKFQCVLWRSNATDDLKVYQLCTVTYGTTSAPYQATRCLKVLAEEGSSTFSLGSTVLKEDFYMDDLISGADSLAELHAIYKEVRELVGSAGFELRKWWTNEETLLKDIPETDRERPLRINDSDIIKTLGIKWNTSTDELQYVVPDLKALTRITKRIILAELSTLFDPLGLINPVVVKGKIILQGLWVSKVTWDESVQSRAHSEWEVYRNRLKELESIKVPRFVLVSRPKSLQLHGFSDASLRAYGCCVYIRVVDENDCVCCNLVTAKSKVAPIKTQSLPRLELCAAEMLSSLLVRILPNFVPAADEIFCWTDSEIVLCWLSSHPSTWEVFIANRVSKIQNNVPQAHWSHVATRHNPADIISRGAFAEELVDSRWFVGPSFIYSSEECWPKKKDFSLINKEVPGKRKSGVVLVSRSVSPNFAENYTRFGSLQKTCRIFAIVLRFIKNLRKSKWNGEICFEENREFDLRGRKITKLNWTYTAKELNEAQIRIIWHIQQGSFSEEICQLEKGNMISPSSYVKNLNPFLDKGSLKLLRVGGRLQNADIPYIAKCPILLPKSHPFVKNLFVYLHRKNYHAGPQALVGIVRQRLWVMDARRLAKKTVDSCLHCFKYKPKLMSQIMGELPAGRVQPARPFQKTGVDFCGPFKTTLNRRGQRNYKSYVAVFVCFVVKAVHLEVVSDLSSEGFLAALKRFIARRGVCQDLYCDNGTNFVGARNELKVLKNQFLAHQTQKKIAEWCAAESIEFHHIPPRAPHFGGLWEAAVKSAKNHLFRTVSDACLTFEELSTVVAEVEAVLNSRPICAMSSDPSDESVLTPGHFVIGSPLNAIAEPLITDYKTSSLSRWRRLTLLKQHFWNRWSKEYLLGLQKRHKWQTSSANTSVGTLVLVWDDKTPPQQWLLGRICNLIRSSDGKVRVVDVSTKNGIQRRAIHRLAPLPMDN